MPMPAQSPQRQRLRTLMEARREELRLPWTEVAAAGGTSVKTISNVRIGEQGILPETRHMIETGLRWAPGSIEAILAGGDPAPLPPGASRVPPGRHARQPDSQWPPAPQPDGQWLPPLPGDQLAAAWPYFAEITEDLRLWTARYAQEHPGVAPADIPEPPGAELFGTGTDDAADWDRRAGLFTAQERAWLIAAVRSRAAARERGRGAGTGLAAGSQLERRIR
jgi:hypothetical protein